VSRAGAYYNEIDPKAAAWLRELVKRGHIADGVVDERSIVDVAPDDLRGFTQCHFFAGIGVWSYALRRAGWADDRPVWTGSCPCQPFSAAGARGGVADERHLWPHWHHLIDQCRPPVVFGEQVASKDGLGWLDLVQADLEGAGYASGAADLCAAGVGAPHIRQRLWFVGLADADQPGLEGRVGVPERAAERPAGSGGVADDMEHATGDGRVERRAEPSGRGSSGGRGDGGLADATGTGSLPGSHPGIHRGQESAGPRNAESERSRSVIGLAHSYGGDASAERQQRGGEQRQQPQDGGFGWLAHSDHAERRADGTRWDDGDGHDTGREEGSGDAEGCGSDGSPGPTNGHWRDADWLFCRDGKWRPVESGTFPLAHGSAARVGRLRGYGNAIVAPAAQAFIESVMEISNA